VAVQKEGWTSSMTLHNLLFWLCGAFKALCFWKHEALILHQSIFLASCNCLRVSLATSHAERYQSLGWRVDSKMHGLNLFSVLLELLVDWKQVTGFSPGTCLVRYVLYCGWNFKNCEFLNILHPVRFLCHTIAASFSGAWYESDHKVGLLSIRRPLLICCGTFLSV